MPPLKESGKLITDPHDKAELLNKTFNVAFSEGQRYTDSEAAVKCPLLLDKDAHPTMKDFHITTPGVEKLLANLDPNKAPGPDGISPRILKTLAPEAAPILSVIYEHSHKTGDVPEDWRTAHVTPIYKKGEHYKPSNYRPVSLTSVPCKLMEHIIVTNVMSHLETNEILAPQQHGFRKRHSCETQLLELTEEINSNLDSGLQTDVVVLDFAKAFDKVNHSLLVHKLQHYGIKGNTCRWINNFLSDRKQAVVVEGTKSDYISVRSGVPQGSVLGPCLFLAYINDLPTQVKSNTRLFADDTAIDRPICNSEDHQSLQKDLNALEDWEERWDMRFHPDKCTTLSANRSKTQSVKPVYTLHGQTLAQVDSVKYLGVTLQKDGNWNEHIKSTTTKASQTLGFLGRNLRISCKSIKEQAYKMLVRPVLEYAAAVWDPHTKQDIKEVEKVQRRAARFVLRRYHNTSSVSDMLTTLKWPALTDRRRHARLRHMYKTLNGLSSVLNTKIIHAPPRSRRCHNQQITRVTSRNGSDYRLQSFLPRTIRDWNNLTSHIVSASNLDIFNQRMSSE